MQKVDKIENFLTVLEVPSLLSVKPSTVYQRASSGEIPHYRLGRILRFKRKDLEAWIEGHRKEKMIGEQRKAREILRSLRGKTHDIDSILKKSTAEVRGNQYTSSHRETRPIKGLGKEVEDGTLS